MPRDSTSDHLNQQAFEFVLGTLRGSERKKFAQKMASDSDLARQVHFWEEHLMELPEPQPVQPATQTWEKISARLNAETRANSEANNSKSISQWWRVKNWLIPSALGSVCTLLAVFITLNLPMQANSQYIAVLNDGQGRPALTAVTQGDTANMRIQWEQVPLAADKNLQLWAVSKRDGQTRSLAVFSSPDATHLQLDTPQLRLIKDADSLLLTEEDIGGSAIDEPSQVVLAKGICVRFAAQ